MNTTVLTADVSLALLHSLIGKFLTALKQGDGKKALCILSNIKDLQLTKSKRAMEIQCAFLILVEHIIHKHLVSYSELAKEMNDKCKLNLPEAGSAMGKKIGGILGELSTISYVCTEVLLSVYVINKTTQEPGTGLENLKIVLSQYSCNQSHQYDKIQEKDKVDKLFEPLRNCQLPQVPSL